MIYCEGAKGAEVLFSLTGGREGRVVVLNPPIEIKIGKANKIEYYVSVGFVGQLFQTRGIYFDFSESNISLKEHPQSFGYDAADYGWFLKQSQYEKYKNPLILQLQLFYYKFNDSGSFSIYDKILLPVIATVGWSVAYLAPFEEAKCRIKYCSNVFVISDATGVIYSQEFPQGMTPTYKVNCITCPPGLCACRGKGEKIYCVDCPKVISGLNNASKKIDSIYG